MGFPKKIKKDLSLTPHRTLYPRRLELLDKINEHGTYLPKSILHADLDRGFLDFVVNELKVVSEGKKIPVVDILITTQNWTQFTETWNFQDLDKNTAPPFICVLRHPEVKYGTTPSLQYTIPNRRQFYYASVPSFDGNNLNVDVYQIPQPVPVDIKFSVKIICNRMRELNTLNKTILQKFSSRQAYTQIKGHYIPIIMDNISDESVMDIEKRKFYIQNYDFTMMGFLIDEDEFVVKPGIERVLKLIEVPNSKKVKGKFNEIANPSSYPVEFVFEEDKIIIEKTFYDLVNLNLITSVNVSNYDIYINGFFYGTNLLRTQINNNDVVRFEIVQEQLGKPSKLSFVANIV